MVGILFVAYSTQSDGWSLDVLYGDDEITWRNIDKCRLIDFGTGLMLSKFDPSNILVDYKR